MKESLIMNDNKPSSQHMRDDSDLSGESWKIFQIMAEFVEGHEKLACIRPSVSMFSSARFNAGPPYNLLVEEIPWQLSAEGYSVASRGGPGLMKAFNKGAYGGKDVSVGLNILLSHE